MIEKLDNHVSKIENQQMIVAIRKGLLRILPLILIGYVILAVIDLPILEFQNILLQIFGEGWRAIAISIHKATIQTMEIATLITVSFAIVNEKELVRSGRVSPISVVITTLVSFNAFTKDKSMVMDMKFTGSTGMLGALVIAVVASNLFCFIYSCRDRIRPANPFIYKEDALIRSSIRVVVPSLLTISMISVARMLLDLTGLADSQTILLQKLTLAEDGILTKGFFDTFVFLGGAGATLGLVIALLVSPYYFVPFLFTPIILSATAFVSIRIGWVPMVTQPAAWTTPIFLSGYMGTGSVAGAVMQGVNLLLSTLIYTPFIRLQIKHQQRQRVAVFKNLVKEIQYIQEATPITILHRQDATGSLARILAVELEYGLKNNKQTVHLEYQPKVNSKCEVSGAEALLRWNHPVYGDVSPLVIVCICDEAGLTNQLGTWIMKQAFRDLRRWHEQGHSSLSLSVNLSPRQLQEDDHLVQTIQSCIDRAGVDPKYMELELTENAALEPSDSTRRKFEQIKATGINVAIDDFGMGHSSLLYLCDFYVNIVKVDISLVRTIVSDKQRQQIVKSIISLCRQLNVKVVAEGVETKQQVDILQELGCGHYQGFYFSKSLPFKKFLEFVNEHGES
ncbi:hypothetical protein BVG16_02330 [Paenibacillus selenitireducens]|uniref:EAL domain-containing protein n=1 Tax=Paenibacillus selenitireducens TaxID=1324314 RepID=A0A1T2XN73_9BACL|nr:EAL domain-containing protein [Paenibacillus selenitireducens]OPA81186.1 hypothetical protein BVG16_02330 [Paenibacillus selenitireducens]